MKEIIISKAESNQRVDKYLMKYLSQASKGFIYKMLRKKRIKLNHKRIQGHEILGVEDTIQLYMAEDTLAKFSGQDQVIVSDIELTFKVVYEDEHLLICHKPTGLLSQKDASGQLSLVEEATSYLMKKGDYNKELTPGFRIGVSNRLDRNTSGIVMVGKELQAVQQLNKLIENKAIDKHYKCLVVGRIENGQEIEGYLTKDSARNTVQVSSRENEGHYIKTIYKPLITSDNYTLLDVQIITGKSHQIRAHLSSIGHPLVGDYKYGNRSINDLFKKRYGLFHQLLHAYKVIFHVNDGVLAYLDNKTFIDRVDGLFADIVKDTFEEVVK